MQAEIPCRIGDVAWGIRCYKGIHRAQKGFVNEIFFTNQMRLTISIKHVCLGEWGKKIFATEEECNAAIAILNQQAT